MKHTKQQLEDWKRYERVRKGGRYNMYFPQARAATGLSRERYAYAMDNYAELAGANAEKGRTK